MAKSHQTAPPDHEHAHLWWNVRRQLPSVRVGTREPQVISCIAALALIAGRAGQSSGRAQPAASDSLPDTQLFRIVLDAERAARGAAGAAVEFRVDSLPDVAEDSTGRPLTTATRELPSGPGTARRKVLEALNIQLADTGIRSRCTGGAFSAVGGATGCPDRPQVQVVISRAQPAEDYWTFMLPTIRGQRFEGKIPPRTVSVSVVRILLGPRGRMENGRDYLLRQAGGGWVIDRSVDTYVRH